MPKSSIRAAGGALPAAVPETDCSLGELCPGGWVYLAPDGPRFISSEDLDLMERLRDFVEDQTPRCQARLRRAWRRAVKTRRLDGFVAIVREVRSTGQ